MNDLHVHCVGCRDTFPVTTDGDRCLCGAVFARQLDDRVFMAGPGQVLGGSEAPQVIRPSFVGT